MPAPSTDCVVRVKALKGLSQLFTSRTIEQQVFDLVLRNLYSNMWILIDPGLFCYKLSDVTPKTQVITLIEKLGKTRLATVFRARSEDHTRSLYLLRLNPRMISKMCRRKTNKYVLKSVGKIASGAAGDEVLIDKDKVHSLWLDAIVFKEVSDGDVNIIRYAIMKNIEWERIL